MKTKLDVLGILIDAYHVEDIIEKIDNDTKKEGFFTYALITKSLLMAANQDKRLKQFIEELDIDIIGEKEVLEATKVEDERLMAEAANNEFLAAFFLYAASCQKSIFLLGEKQEDITLFKNYLNENHKGISILGTDCLSKQDADGVDRVINEINSSSPEMVITCSEQFGLEYFVMENRKKMNAKAWLSLDGHFQFQNDVGLKSNWLSKLLEKTTFKKLVSKYNSEKGE